MSNFFILQNFASIGIVVLFYALLFVRVMVK